MIRQHIIRLHIISFRWRQAKYSREKPLLPVIKALDHVIATSDLEYLMRDILRAHLQTIYCIYDELQLFNLCFLGVYDGRNMLFFLVESIKKCIWGMLSFMFNRCSVFYIR